MKKIAAISATALAIVGAAATATPSSARDYGYYGAAETCHAKKQDKGATGAVIGGLAGALLGSQVAGHGSHTGGALIGGLAGALIGNGVGRSSASDSRACQAASYGRVAYRGYDDGARAYRYSGYDRGVQPYRYSGYDPYGY
jgi:hypothetical protein